MRLSSSAKLCGLLLIANFAFSVRSFADQTPAPKTPQAWSAAAAADVQAAYRLYVANHPGMLNPDDKGFPDRLEAARRRGLELAAQARDQAGLSASLGAFSAQLRDGHAAAVSPTPAETARWPGFVAVWRGDSLFVFASEDADLKPGAEISGCDGLGVRTLVMRNVFAFGGRPAEAGQWWTQARNLFRDDGNPFITLPRRCRVSSPGKVSDIDLHWRPIDPRYKAWREASYNGDALPVGVSEPRKSLVWIALPTFDPDASERDAYSKMFATLRRRRSELLADDAIVIDLRDNQGGSSFWSETLAKALWGDQRVDALDASSRTQVWWRASPGNTTYMANFAAKLGAETQVEAAAWAQNVANGMQAARAKGQSFYIEPPDPTPSGATAKDTWPELKTPVYVIVPGQCASACLDALDVFTQFPNTKLIGAPSSADSAYLEIRIEPLPDGVSKAVIPIKFYRYRRRAPGAVYRPAIEIDDLAWSTGAFRDAIETDLKARRRSTSARRAGDTAAIGPAETSRP